MLQKEIEFCNYFKQNILPNRHRVDGGMVSKAAAMMGITPNLSCHSCLHGSAMDLLNLYNRLLPAYEEYLKEPVQEVKPIEEVKPVKTKVVKKEVKNDPDMDDFLDDKIFD